ncbi:MAG: hypothetical protein HC769_30910, partial [Cyanobacteria bacterium CRU_2_1]|nr:hypothetical protein [Cyanobacteria bacterium CRU_2_1]
GILLAGSRRRSPTVADSSLPLDRLHSHRLPRSLPQRVATADRLHPMPPPIATGTLRNTRSPLPYASADRSTDFSLNADRLQSRVQDLDAEPANDQDKRRQIASASQTRSLVRPLHRLVSLLSLRLFEVLII